MIQTMKRSLAMLMVLVMLLALVPALLLNVNAEEFSYVYSSDGKYIYNWGTRGTTATSLSPNAKAFYEDNNTSYDELSALSGSSNRSDVPSSALYKTLQTLMKSNHSYQNGYSANNDLLKYTDCQNSGGAISSFYSGNSIGPAWDSGNTWNKEHTWPNSKGLEGKDEDDIMMIRPTSVQENSSRGNTAYGQSSGYYNPNSESNGKYDLRGDVARIFLYVYVRWGNTSKAWGTSGVMESVDVLLAWMEADPVDTWELGRNDSVESITGTRNVFVDYPELGFLLFDAEIPANLTTPSGEASGTTGKCDHNNFDAGVVTAPTCTQKGSIVYTCQTAGCGYVKTTTTPATGHNYVDGACTVCGESTPVVPTYVTSLTPGTAYKLGMYSTPNAAEYYFSGTIINNYYGATDTSFANGVDVYVEQTTGGYHLSFKNSSGQKQYINVVASGDYRNFSIASTASTVYTWDATKNTLKTTVSGDVCYIGNYGTYTSLNIMKESKLTDSDYLARFYVMGDGAQDAPSDTPDTPAVCTHSYNTTVTAPTCTAGGFTTYVCTLCAYSYIGSQTAAAGHSYTDGTCSKCGAEQPAGGTTESTTVTITFDANKTNRTEFSTTKQVWVYNGLTVTNDKASSSDAVADYSAPVRCYKGSNVTISYPGMTKIVIDCVGVNANSKDYVSAWLNVTGATATNDNNVITIVLDAPADSFTITGLSKQARANSITVYAGDSQSQPSTPEVCAHTNTTVIGATQATCTNNGFTGNTVCSQCNTITVQGTVISANGHTYGEWTIVTVATCTTAGVERRDCSVCDHYETKNTTVLGHKDTNSDNICDTCNTELSTACKHTQTTVEGAMAATCTTDGNTGTTRCTQCNTVLGDAEIIPATGHTLGEWRTINAATCSAAGLNRKDCSDCTYYETEEVSALAHTDADEDDICDVCNGNMPKQEHVCEEASGWKKFWNSIANFFRRLFGTPEICTCGEELPKKEEE